jgi:alpha 1,2-mannosyltransferase
VPEKLDVGYDPNVDRPRPDVLWMEPGDIKRMREAHSNFISDLKKAPPQLVYNVGTQGIVMTAGLSQLPVLVISIRMLRRTWSLVPVEVFLSKESDYDAEICDTVLPTLNAKCLLFSDIFHAAESGVPIDRFQFKIMAILFSSFDQVLLLDSDAFPINDPVYMFDNEPFNSTGMIVWPDFWYASESPYYFDIAKIPSIPPLKERAAVESGEIAYSKSKHHLSIMLAAYYNFYGPQYYYPLLSQGAPGEGDKETFVWAARVFNESFYAVRERVMALGRHDSSGQYLGSAMTQHDPVAAYNMTMKHNESKAESLTEDKTHDITASAANPFFIHANFPKFDPSTVFDYQMHDFNDQVVGEGGPTKDSNGTSVRCWMGEARAVELFGFDIERRFWEEIMGTACEYETKFTCWKGKTGICDRVRRYWHDVFEPVIQP